MHCQIVNKDVSWKKSAYVSQNKHILLYVNFFHYQKFQSVQMI